MYEIRRMTRVLICVHAVFQVNDYVLLNEKNVSISTLVVILEYTLPHFHTSG